jgi:hypothetical protein
MNKPEFPGFEELAPRIKKAKKGEVPLATAEEEAQVDFWAGKSSESEVEELTAGERLDQKRQELEIAYKEKFLVTPRDLSSEEIIAALADPEKEMIRLYDIARLEDNKDRDSLYNR